VVVAVVVDHGVVVIVDNGVVVVVVFVVVGSRCCGGC
jgi:hypothetical protein